MLICTLKIKGGFYMRDVFDMETTKERIEYIRSLSEVDVYLQLLWALDELKELRDKLQSYEFEKKVEEDLKRLGY